MEFDFVIPQVRSELLRSGRVNQYVVEELLPVRQMAVRLTAFESDLCSQGPTAILQHFDVLYSVLCQFKSVQPKVQQLTLDLVMKAVSRHTEELPCMLGDGALMPADKARCLNALKMGVYLLTQLAEAFEERAARGARVGPSGKVRRAQAAVGEDDWELGRVEVVHLLSHLLQLELRPLWALGLVEADFTRVVSSCCYRLLENPSVTSARSRPLREAVAHLLGMLVKRYNHMMGATLNVIQMLQQFEHVPGILAQVVGIWATDYGAKTIVGEIMREIGQCSEGDGGHDSPVVRAFSTFLSELSELVPAAMTPHTCLLLGLLDRESYTLRNAVLTCVTQILRQVLSGPGLEEGLRGLRDTFLDTLQLHLHDCHALVRARCLQLLGIVVSSKALPVRQFLPLVTLVTGRLCDKAVNVSRQAINLLGLVVANNPFTGKINIEDVRSAHTKQMEKLALMREDAQKMAGVVVDPAEEWNAMLPEIHSALLFQEVEGGENDKEWSGLGEGDPSSPSGVRLRIRSLLKNGKYRQAALLARGSQQLFLKSEDLGSGDKEEEEETLLQILEACIRAEGLSKQSVTPTPVPQEGEDGPSDLARQEVLVTYLHDTLIFAEKIQGAIQIVGTLLGSKNPSVVQDAAQFLVTVSEFGVPGSLEGMRRMLPLVWSKEPGVREAVVRAYRRLYLGAGDRARMKPQALVSDLTALVVDSTVERIKCLEELVTEFVKQQEVDPAVIQLLWERFTGKIPCSAEERRAAVVLLGMAARGEPEIVGSNLEILFTVGFDTGACHDYQLARDVCVTISKLSLTRKGSSGQSCLPLRLPCNHPLFTRLCTAVAEGFTDPSPHWHPFAEAAVSLVYHLAEGPDRLCGQLLVCCSRLLVSHNEGPIPPDHEGSQGKGHPTHLLTHLLTLVGHVALQQVVHLERALGPELQRRRQERDGRRGERQRSSVSAMEVDLGLSGVSAEDPEGELVRRVCDEELLRDGQLLSAFLPLVVTLCSQPGLHNDAELSTVSCLTLCKLALVSQDFCENHLRLLFTLLEKSPIPAIRANTLVALGDLCLRYPNVIEPWTPHLYARLRDTCETVRRTATVVMTHLILKDVVRVRGQISDMACLLVDPQPDIARLARSFFHELSSKDNAVYNILPDIISRLSDPECGIKEEAFRTVMSQLFNYISKERQSESLIEKLCQRFRTASQPRQLRDLAYCLSRLPPSERCLRRLLDQFNALRGKLEDDVVHSLLLATAARFRRALRLEVRGLVDELEQRITRARSGELANVRASRPAKTPGKSELAKCRKKSTEMPLSVPRVRQPRKTSRKVRISFSSDENYEDEEALLMESETPKVTSPLRRCQQPRRTMTACN